MDEDNEINLKYAYDIDINYHAAQKLESLSNKYNINTKSHLNNREVISSSSTSSSQQSSESRSSKIHRVSSNSSDASSNQQTIQQAKASSKSKKIHEERPKTATTNKYKYENVITKIDSDILSTYGQQLLNELETLEIKYEVKSQIHSNLVTWTYTSDAESDSDIVLLILNWKDLIDHITSNSLIGNVTSLLEILPKSRISLGLYGFQNYFKYWKSQKQGKVNDKKYNEYKNSFKINRQELEYMLTELELRCSCSHRFLENIQDVVNVISQYTKSIALLPEKLEQQDKYKNVDFYMMKDNRDCVMVDKSGNGFKRLWQQQLTTFEMVRLETAEAVISKYPTPSQLFEAYENCQTKSEGVKLLEELPIRRAAGPLTSSRKLGPELSNKIYNLFHAVEGNAAI